MYWVRDWSPPRTRPRPPYPLTLSNVGREPDERLSVVPCLVFRGLLSRYRILLTRPRH